MRYSITHRTTYRYESPVTVGHYTARLQPRTLPGQDCPWHDLRIVPRPSGSAKREDYFGNLCVYFEIEGSHQSLEIVSRNLIDIHPSPPPDPALTPPWESVREACHGDALTPSTAAGEFAYASPLVPVGDAFAAYARPSFPAQRPILEGVIDLNSRIFRDFAFDSTATDHTTPVSEVLTKNRGVCQDFAQVMIACLRSLGLPARYVSGYLETFPPPGQPKMIGAEASHAWVSVFCGDANGWMDADPTNDVLPSTRHLTLAWGRDFSDVSPLRGVTLGAGNQSLTVAVDVAPLEE